MRRRRRSASADRVGTKTPSVDCSQSTGRPEGSPKTKTSARRPSGKGSGRRRRIGRRWSSPPLASPAGSDLSSRFVSRTSSTWLRAPVFASSAWIWVRTVPWLRRARRAICATVSPEVIAWSTPVSAAVRSKASARSTESRSGQMHSLLTARSCRVPRPASMVRKCRTTRRSVSGLRRLTTVSAPGPLASRLSMRSRISRVTGSDDEGEIVSAGKSPWATCAGWLAAITMPEAPTTIAALSTPASTACTRCASATVIRSRIARARARWGMTSRSASWRSSTARVGSLAPMRSSQAAISSSRRSGSSDVS